MLSGRRSPGTAPAPSRQVIGIPPVLVNKGFEDLDRTLAGEDVQEQMEIDVRRHHGVVGVAPGEDDPAVVAKQHREVRRFEQPEALPRQALASASAG